MWRDLRHYFRALGRHFVGFAGGALVGFALLVWQNILKKGDIPTSVWWIAALAGVFVSGFLAWREQYRNVQALEDPAEELKRDALWPLLQKLDATQQLVLGQLVSLGRLSPLNTASFLMERRVWGGGTVMAYEAQASQLLGRIAENGLITFDKGSWEASRHLAKELRLWASGRLPGPKVVPART